MNSFRPAIRIVIAIVIVLLMAIIVVAFLPPWWGKPFYMIHVRMNIPYRFQAGWPPQNFSGIWRDYDSYGIYDELSYKNGQRDGLQLFYDKKGRLERKSEFKGGKPWSGLCDFWEYKPWLAEYRDGKVWTGAMQELDTNSPSEYAIRYYFKGKLYNEAEYRQLMGFGTNGGLIGIYCVTIR